MPRIQYTKKAQQRYAMVPDLDANGVQKQVPVMGRNGTQKTTKHGTLVVRKLTVRDMSKPLANHKCEVCKTEIKPGMPYKFVEPQMGATRYRCMACPTWQPWDLSNSLAARIQQLQDQYSKSVDRDDDDKDSLEAHVAEAAEEIRALAEEKRESASNIEEGFGHPTYQSDELNEIADNLDGWADEVEQASFDDKPDEVDEPGDEPLPPVDENDEEALAAWEDEHATWEEASQEFDQYEADLEEWVSSSDEAISGALDNCPV